MQLDGEKVKTLLVDFIRQETDAAGFKNLVLGLSGGVDSSLVAFLAAEAVGPEHVTAVLMPYKTSSPESAADAEAVVEKTGMRSVTISITEQIDSYFEKVPDANRLRRANKMARERMSILYDQSAALKALVIGTSNKTEILLGYGTIHGDMACAFNPIGGLYKTQVRQLAAHVGVPERIIRKAPTADLWPGQTDEGELGFTYADVDRLLLDMVEGGMTDKELIEKGHDISFIQRVRTLITRSRHKRRPPAVLTRLD
ncbi:MAG: NAD+ synthase [Planctomycetota bacterium]